MPAPKFQDCYCTRDGVVEFSDKMPKEGILLVAYCSKAERALIRRLVERSPDGRKKLIPGFPLAKDRVHQLSLIAEFKVWANKTLEELDNNEETEKESAA